MVCVCVHVKYSVFFYVVDFHLYSSVCEEYVRNVLECVEFLPVLCNSLSKCNAIIQNSTQPGVLKVSPLKLGPPTSSTGGGPPNQ